MFVFKSVFDFTKIEKLLAEAWAHLALAKRWHFPLRQKDIKGSPIVISLTSYPPRYGTLELTLKSLITQSLRPTAILLWLSEKDAQSLPKKIRDLQSRGLKIEYCEDFKSYNKYVHAIKKYPDARIAICDDDCYYWATWLEELVAANNSPDVYAPCHRAHYISLSNSTVVSSYVNWTHEWSGNEISRLVFPTGVGGVLIQRSQFSDQVFDMAVAQEICPTADDVWLYWSIRSNGLFFKHSKTKNKVVVWKASQEVALWRTNNAESNGNDRQIQAMISHFGFPQGVNNG